MKTENKEKEVLLTGKVAQKDVQDDDFEPCCFLCKRTSSEESFFLTPKGYHGKAPILLSRFSVQNGEYGFNFIICQECGLLIKGILQMVVGKDNEIIPEHIAVGRTN
ncbi:MAG: hypothetical protein V2A65_02935 [Candidatus Omnitrophota bacterium]